MRRYLPTPPPPFPTKCTLSHRPNLPNKNDSHRRPTIDETDSHPHLYTGADPALYLGPTRPRHHARNPTTQGSSHPSHGDRSMGQQRVRPVESATHGPWREYWPRGGPWFTTQNVHHANLTEATGGWRVMWVLCAGFSSFLSVGCMGR